MSIVPKNDNFAIATALRGISVKFLLQPDIEFEVFMHAGLSPNTLDIIDEFLTQVKPHIRVIHLDVKDKPKRLNEFTTVLRHSAFIFIESMEDFIKFNEVDRSIRYNDKPMKFIVYITNLSALQLNLLLKNEIFINFNHLDLFSDKLFIHSLFIVDDHESLSLVSAEYFSEEHCNELTFKELTRMDKKTLVWTPKLTNYEKFFNYFGCSLMMVLPLPTANTFLNHLSGYSIYDEKRNKFLFFGITPNIFLIAAGRYNFSPAFLPGILPPSFIMEFGEDEVQFHALNGESIVPQIYFEMEDITCVENQWIRLSNVFHNEIQYLVATPARRYTKYEKLALPFDLSTWILILVTFLTSFATIFIINRLSRSAQNTVYGRRVQNPFWNVVSISFGISQTQLPAQNFPRIILIIFIFFCLIFRTCYQSKFFEFMTSEPRRSPPKTVKDLFERKYTIYYASTLDIENKNNKDPAYMHPLSPEIFYSLFTTQSQNDSANIALEVSDYELHHYRKYKKENIDWHRVDGYVDIYRQGIDFREFSFYYPAFNWLINWLIDMGVMDYLVKNFYIKKVEFYRPQVGPRVLGMPDLSFGFNIWIGCCLISIIAFAIEIVVRLKRPENFIHAGFTKIKHAKVQPILEMNVEGPSEIMRKRSNGKHQKVLKEFRVKVKPKGEEIESKRQECVIDLDNN